MFSGAIIAGASGQGGGFYPFEIDQSLRFEDGDSAYLSRTPASVSNRKTMTFSFWFKRGNFGATQKVFSAGVNSSNHATVDLRADGRLQVFSNTSGVQDISIVFDPIVFRDVSAWYHFTVIIDTTSSTQTDRVQLYVNGTRHTGISSTGGENIWPDQNDDSQFNTTVEHNIGRRFYSANAYYDGYLADVNFIDGTAYTADSFGQLKSGIWIPKDTAGLTFGTNGFRLEYADSAAIGDDTSGNTNDWAVNNLVASDVVLDSPTNNFSVLRNMGAPPASGAGITEGNLHYTSGSSGSGRNQNRQAISTILPTSGKWYAECRVQSSTNQFIGVGPYQVDIAPTSNNTRYSYIRPLAADVYTRTGSSETITNNYGSAGAVGDVFGVYLDLDASPPEVYYSKNGSWGDGSGNFDEATPTTAVTLGDSFQTTDSGGNQGVGFIFSSASSGTSVQGIWNFGQDSTFAGNETAGGNVDANGLGDFFSTVPSGALALCTANLPSGAIDTAADETPDEYFNVVEYTGNNPNTNSITGVGFQPDFIWIDRISTTQTARTCLYDVIRPLTNRISSSTDNVQTSGKLSSFDSDGFTLAADTATNSFENRDGETMVVWNWKAGGSGSSNSDGSITSTVSVGSTSAQKWFSIVKYAGTGSSGTYGHGLDAAPDLILTKNTDQSDDWAVYSSVLGTGKYINLSADAAAVTAADIYPSVSSTTIGVQGSNGKNNTSGEDYISYCFVNAEGFCKAGSFVGNNSTDGPFVYLGFRPRYFFLKESDGTGGWKCVDTLRSPINPNTVQVELDSAGGQDTNTDYHLDILSNGFKLRTSQTEWNGSGDNYIFLAIAEQPFKYANAR